MNARRLAAALATTIGTVLLAAPAIPVAAAPPARMAVPQPPPGGAVVTVKTGGDRAGDGSLVPLPGVTLGLYPTESDAVPALECVSDGDGDCNFVVEDASNLIGTRPFVKQIAAPGGWFANPSLRTGPGSGSGSVDSPYVFQTPTLEAGSTYSSQSDFMFSSTLGSNYTASNGVWQNSRVNPPLPSRCGLDIAVVLDLSASVGATNLPILKSATDQLVDAFVGTPSRMAVFGFARYSPNQNATTNEIYPNHPELQSVSTQAGADEFKSQYADWGLGSGTNWDQALYRVATSGVHYDATIVLTDGNPTRWGLQGPPVTPSGDGSNTHFADVEEAIFSANLLKKNETRVVSFGIGRGVSGVSGLNLAAISGQTAYDGTNVVDADYFQIPNFEGAGETLREFATASCTGSVSVVKEVVPAGGDLTDAVPAPGWEFDAAGADGVTVDPPAATTDETGGVSFEVGFPQGQTSGGVTVTETQKPDYTLVTQDGLNASCVDRVTGDPVAVTNSGETGFDITVDFDSAVTCTVYNRAPAVEVTVDKEWIVDGVTYREGSQPDGLDATLTLSGPGGAPLTEQSWGVPRGGYDLGEEIQFDETTTITDEACVLDDSRVTERNGTAVDADLPYSDDLAGLSNTYLVTNTVSCEAAPPGGSLGSLGVGSLGSLGVGSLGSLGVGSLGSLEGGSLDVGSLGAGSVGSLGSLGSLGALGSAGSAGPVIPPVPPAPPGPAPTPTPPPSTGTPPPPGTSTPTPTPAPPSSGPRPNAIDGGAAERHTVRNLGITAAGLVLLGLAGAGAVAIARRRSS